MRKMRVVELGVFAIVAILVLGVTGCVFSLFPKVGDMARGGDVVTLRAGAEQNGTIETNDLTFTYSLKYDQGRYELHEDVKIDQSITYSFSRVRSFFIKMSFLDSGGVVLDTVDVTPLVSLHSGTPEKLTTKKSGPVPPGAVAVAFSWYGSFYSGLRDTSGSWDIHYFPFDRQ